MRTSGYKQKSKNLDRVNTVSDLIKSLCTESYSIYDVDEVVDYFYKKIKYLIKYKQFLYNEWLETEDEIRDLCYDFIAPLFARDNKGHFYRLNDYFESKFDLTENDLNIEITKLLKSVIKQESILIYASRDPYGKIFYDSLQYLLKKHNGWNKSRDSQYGIIIKGYSINNAIYTESLDTLYQQCKTESLTKTLEGCLSIIIDRNDQFVSILDLLKIFRQQEYIKPGFGERLKSEDPSLNNSVELIANKTLSFIESTLLDRYIQKGAITKNEHAVFCAALKHALNDFSNGGLQYSYYEYLNNSFNGQLAKEHYINKYRTRFEYLVKTAKKEFSANIKIEFNLKV